MLNNTNNLNADQENFLSQFNQEYINGCGFLNQKSKKRSTIYGGHAVEKSSALYKDTYQIAQVLASCGYAVMNGGGPGMMQAATEGAESVGGDTVAITMNIANEPPQEIVDTKITTTIFSVRKYLLYSSEVLLFVPGGWGTLDELAEVVVLSRFNKIPVKKIFLYNREFWEEFLNWIHGDLVEEWGLVQPSYTRLFEIIDNPVELEQKLAVTKNPQNSLG
jgi:uncharacterized protein (TIGR00730 family)